MAVTVLVKFDINNDCFECEKSFYAAYLFKVQY